jgi:HEPN domain-containing protein
VASAITHAVVGLALAWAHPASRVRPRLYVVSAALAVLPDADVLGFALGVPYPISREASATPWRSARSPTWARSRSATSMGSLTPRSKIVTVLAPLAVQRGRGESGMPPSTTSEDFNAAARRNLCDAEHLLAAERWDGAVHLAGFAGESAIKGALGDTLGAAFKPKDFGHDLEDLAGFGMGWLVAASGSAVVSTIYTYMTGSFLGHGHPDRRYWPDGWTRIEAEDTVRAAARIVEHTTLARILDQGLALAGA